MSSQSGVRSRAVTETDLRTFSTPYNRSYLTVSEHCWFSSSTTVLHLVFRLRFGMFADTVRLTNACIITRRSFFVEYWKHFVARFNDVHASGYNSAGGVRIRMKFGAFRVYCLKLALTYFGRDPRKSESGRSSRSFVFLTGK